MSKKRPTSAALSTFSPLTVLLLTVLITAGGCTTDSPSESGLDHTFMTTTAIGGTGSRNVRPPNAWHRDPMAGQPAALSEVVHPEVPVERIAALRRNMTEAEVEAVLGPPGRKHIQVLDVDTGGNDWNPWIWSYRFQDSRYGVREMTRDLELYFGYVHAKRPLPERPELEGPAWVLLDWEFN